MLIDTHAHLNFSAYKEDLERVMKRALDANIQIINVGSQYKTSQRAVEIAEKYSQGVYAAIGLHPINLDTGLVKIKVDEKEGRHFEKEFDFEKYKQLARSKKVVAVGEIGLDYYYKPKTKIKLEFFKEKQRTVLCQQLKLAKELDLPVIFHCRFAHNDLLKILKFQVSSFKFQRVIHCFTGIWEQAEQYLEMGFYLGFNGIIFKLNLDEVIKKIPLERIFLETDCPYLPPPPNIIRCGGLTPLQESGRNEPLFIKYIAQKIAQIKKLSYKKVVEKTTKNAKKFFNI